MNNRARLSTIGIVALLVVGLILLIIVNFSKKSSTLNISQDYSVSTNFGAVQSYGTNEVVYSNGEALMIYNYTTGQGSALSPSMDISTSGIDSISVSSNNQYILFHDQQVSSGGVLYNQLQNAGLNPQNGYWFLYSVTTQTFQPLPQSTIIAKLGSNGVYALAVAAGGEQLVGYSFSNLSQVSSVNVSGVDNFFVTSSGFVVQTPNNEVLLTQNGTVSTELASNAAVLAITPNGQQAVITVTQDGTRQLALLNLQSHTQKAIASNVIGQPVWLPSGGILYNETGGNTTTILYSYNLATQKNYLWSFSGAAAALSQNQQITLEPAALLSPQVAVVSTSSSTYYLVGVDLVKPQIAL